MDRDVPPVGYGSSRDQKDRSERPRAAGSPDRFPQTVGASLLATADNSAMLGGGHDAYLYRPAIQVAQAAPKETVAECTGILPVMRTHHRITPKTLALGRRIADARQKKGLSQHTLATIVGVTPAAVSQWETGRAVPTSEKFELLANALDADPSWLLTGDEPEEKARAQTTAELELLDTVRKMTRDDQARLLSIAHALVTKAR